MTNDGNLKGDGGSGSSGFGFRASFGFGFFDIRYSRARAALLTLCLVLALLPRVRALDAGEQSLFADGLFSRGMYEMAAREYRTLIERDPKADGLDVVYYRLGECHRHLQQYTEAERAYDRVFTDYPAGKYRQRAGLRRAEILMDTGGYKDAVALLDTLLQTKPEPDIAASAFYFLGHSLQKLGSEKQAKLAFERVIKDYADSGVYSYGCLALGGLYAQEEATLDQAIGLYRSAAERPATKRVAAEAWYQLGSLYLRQKHYDKSAAAFERLFTEHPADRRAAEGALQGAWAHYNAGLYAKVLEMARKALAGPAAQEAAKQAEWLYLKANAERQLLKAADAVASYAVLLGKYPDSGFAAAARYEKALTHHKAGEHEAVVRSLAGFTPPAEVEADVYWLLAESYAALDRGDEAIQYYRFITDRFPKHELACDANYQLAHLLKSRGAFRQAARRYAVVVKSFPDHELAPRALFASAFCLAKAGDHEQAARDWAALITRYASDPLREQALYHKALSEVRLKRDAQVQATFGVLLRDFPKSKYRADAHYWLGLVAKEAGRWETASSELRAALDVGLGDALALEAKLQLASVLHKRSEWGPAADLLQELLATPIRAKIVPSFLDWLATYRFEHRQFAEAESAAQLLVQAHKEPVWQQTGWMRIGEARAGAGDNAGARVAFAKALEPSLKSRAATVVALRLAEVSLADGAHDAAEAAFSKASELAGELDLLDLRMRAYEGLGLTAEARGDHEGAGRHFMSVAVLFDEPAIVPRCLAAAAAAYGALGRESDRAEALKELRERYPESEWAKQAGGEKSEVGSRKTEEGIDPPAGRDGADGE